MSSILFPSICSAPYTMKIYFGKIDACIGHTIEIYLLLLGRWLKHGELAMDDVIEVVYRYSREIEHSDENLERAEMLNWFAR